MPAPARLECAVVSSGQFRAARGAAVLPARFGDALVNVRKHRPDLEFAQLRDALHVSPLRDSCLAERPVAVVALE